MSRDERVRVAITQGDVNGVGYEVILKSFADKTLFNKCIPVVYGSPKVLAYYKKVLDLEKIPHNTIQSAADAKPKQINIIDCNTDAVKVTLGQATKEAGQAALAALEKAVEDMKKGSFAALVTAPINKDTIQSEEFSFPGHTEYLEQRFDAPSSLMLMVQDDLRVAVVTGHIPVTQLGQSITKEKVLEKLRLLHQAMQVNFGISKPKIAVLGLNPHAGDNGLLGKEELEIIQPVLEDAKAEGILAMGPFPADGLFGSSSFSRFDAILAMYHDQGLIPFKTLTPGAGVNFTAGLPIVRTSPAHGTAYEIAGKGQALEGSFKEAIFEGIRIFKERQFQQNSLENKLEVKEKVQRKPRRNKID